LSPLRNGCLQDRQGQERLRVKRLLGFSSLVRGRISHSRMPRSNIHIPYNRQQSSHSRRMDRVSLNKHRSIMDGKKYRSNSVSPRAPRNPLLPVVSLPPKPARPAPQNNRSSTQAATSKGYNSRPGKVDHYSPNARSPPRPRSLIDRLAQPNSDDWTASGHRLEGRAYRGDREARRGAPYVRPAGRGMGRDGGRGWERR
jgi:hypothetical protein